MGQALLELSGRAYAVGYLEGCLTQERIFRHRADVWRSRFNSTATLPVIQK